MSPEDDFVLGVFILFLRSKGRLSGRASSVSLKVGPVCRRVDGSSFCRIPCPVGLLYCLSLLPNLHDGPMSCVALLFRKSLQIF